MPWLCVQNYTFNIFKRSVSEASFCTILIIFFFIFITLYSGIASVDKCRSSILGYWWHLQLKIPKTISSMSFRYSSCFLWIAFEQHACRYHLRLHFSLEYRFLCCLQMFQWIILYLGWNEWQKSLICVKVNLIMWEGFMSLNIKQHGTDIRI